MRNQALGLAEHLGFPFQEIRPSDAKTPPFPDIILACGRRVARHARWFGRQGCFVVYIHKPPSEPFFSRFARRVLSRLRALFSKTPARRSACRSGRPFAYDLVLPSYHDACEGASVVPTLLSFHRVRPERMAQALDPWRDRLAPIPGKRKVVALIGGPSRSNRWTRAQSEHIAGWLAYFSAQEDTQLYVTSSRRTPASLRAKIRTYPCYSWHGEGDNPYFALLGLGDIFLVTSDSVSMVSEALFTGKPVWRFFVPTKSRRLSKFHTLTETYYSVSTLPAVPPLSSPMPEILLSSSLRRPVYAPVYALGLAEHELIAHRVRWHYTHWLETRGQKHLRDPRDLRGLRRPGLRRRLSRLRLLRRGDFCPDAGFEPKYCAWIEPPQARFSRAPGQYSSHSAAKR